MIWMTSGEYPHQENIFLAAAIGYKDPLHPCGCIGACLYLMHIAYCTLYSSLYSTVVFRTGPVNLWFSGCESHGYEYGSQFQHLHGNCTCNCSRTGSLSASHGICTCCMEHTVEKSFNWIGNIRKPSFREIRVEA
jgi:hypothetical protein